MALDSGERFSQEGTRHRRAAVEISLGDPIVGHIVDRVDAIEGEAMGLVVTCRVSNTTAGVGELEELRLDVRTKIRDALGWITGSNLCRRIPEVDRGAAGESDRSARY